MAQNTYLFINKTSQSVSLSKSDASERRSMGAYIYGRKKHIEARLADATKHLDQDQTAVEMEIQKVEDYIDQFQSPIPASENDRKIANLHPCNAAYSAGTFDEPDALGCPIDSIWLSESITTWSPSNPSPVQTDPYVRALLEYFVVVYEPSLRYLESMLIFKNPSTIQAQASMMCVRDILRSSMETNALVAAMSARKQDIENIYQDGRDLIYSNLAIQSVSKALAKPLDHPARLLRSVYFLAVVAWHHKDQLALRSHLDALKMIINASGGFQKLSPAIRTILIKFDGTVCAEQFMKPDFASDDFEPSLEDTLYFKKALLEPAEYSSLGQQFTKGSYREICGLDSHRIIIDLVHSVRIVESQLKQPNPCYRLVRLASDRIDLIRHRLLECETTGILHRLLHMSILMWILMVFTSDGTSRSVKIMTVAFRDCLVDLRNLDWFDQGALYAWMLSVGLMGAEDGSATEHYLAFEMKSVLTSTRIDKFDS